MSNISIDSESLGKSNGKKNWSQIWTFFLSGLKLPRKKNVFFWLILPYKIWWKPRFPMDKRPLVEGRIANFGTFLDVFEFVCFGWFFPFFKNFGFWVLLVHPETMLPLAYFEMFLRFGVLQDFFRFSKKSGFHGIGATIRIGREMLCLPYAGFFLCKIILAQTLYVYTNCLFACLNVTCIITENPTTKLTSYLLREG